MILEKLKALLVVIAEHGLQNEFTGLPKYTIERITEPKALEAIAYGITKASIEGSKDNGRNSGI
jgi:hypothetical protein